MNDYRILVVDDEEDLCEILKFNLENVIFHVVLLPALEFLSSLILRLLLIQRSVCC